MKTPSVISLAPSESRVERVIPTFFATGRKAVEFLASRWGVVFLIAVAAWGTALVIAGLNLFSSGR